MMLLGAMIGFVGGVLTAGAAFLAFVALCGLGYTRHAEFEPEYHEAHRLDPG
jgi:hypothetical protein